MNLFEFYQKYDTDEKCENYLRDARWPDGNVSCVYCGHKKCYVIDKQKKGTGKRYKCANNKCYKRFNVTVGTIFHACNVPLWQFFYLIFITALNKKNSSTYQEGINLGITQKTVWFIMMRIRMVCYQDSKLKLSGEVEADETYLASGKWRHTIAKGRKLPIFGMIERGGGKAIIKVIPNKSMKTVLNLLLKSVETESTLYTDSAGCYDNCNIYFNHLVIDHKSGIYVNGTTHTNSVENMWKHFKNLIKRTHNGVSLHHLQRYCDEFVYKWNTKKWSSMERFEDLMNRAINSKPIGQKATKLGGSASSKTNKNKKHKEIVEIQEVSSKKHQPIK